jgi:ppGpp synthetase/RelA/SpoT-type nucleotidyltranferase
LEPDRFGYLSVHYIAAIGPTRRDLAEWVHYGGMRFEIQIRSILQHAWPEIEHDLGQRFRLRHDSVKEPDRVLNSNLQGAQLVECESSCGTMRSGVELGEKHEDIVDVGLNEVD